MPEEISGLKSAGSSHGWMGFIKNGGFYLANMVSSNASPEIVSLPSAVKNPSCLLFESLWDYLHFQRHKHPWNEMDVHKIAISSSPSEANCTVMALTNWGLLAFCRVGDSSWTDLGNQFFYDPEDIIYSKKHELFYTVTREGDLQAWDLKNPELPLSKLIIREDVDDELEDKIGKNSQLASKEHRRWMRDRVRYVVESPEGDIFIVIRYQSGGSEHVYLTKENVSSEVPSESLCRTMWFEVLKINSENEAEVVNCLGDCVLFVGGNESFAVSAKEYPELRPNSIYFCDDTEHKYYEYGKTNGGYDVGVYSLEDHTISPIHLSEPLKDQPAPIWVYPFRN